MLKFKKNIVLVFILSLISCDKKRVFDSYVSFENSVWKQVNKPKFNFEVKDTLLKRDLFINLRNDNSYNYSNLLLITKLVFPDNKIIIDTLEYEMTDKTGKFLGSGFSEVKENKLFYKENIVFPLKGNYSFSVEQAMRNHGDVRGLDMLKGVTELGFRIEKK